MAKRELSPDQAADIWLFWWSDWSMADIARQNSYTIGEIRRVLAAPLPDSLRADERSTGFVHAWWALERFGNLPRDASAMVFYQIPVRVSAKALHRGVGAINRTLKSHGAALSGLPPEQIEIGPCRRMLEKGYLSFTIDAVGDVTEGIRFPEMNADEHPVSTGPSPG